MTNRGQVAFLTAKVSVQQLRPSPFGWKRSLFFLIAKKSELYFPTFSKHSFSEMPSPVEYEKRFIERQVSVRDIGSDSHLLVPL